MSILTLKVQHTTKMATELMQRMTMALLFSVTVKHCPDNWQVRGALWRGLSRPGFKETAPITDYDVDTPGDTSGSTRNPPKPYEADNFDLSLEYYGEGMTYFAVGYFPKSIANAIYPTYQRNGTSNGTSI